MTDDPTKLRKRSVVIAGHSTSVSVEGVFWDELQAIAARLNLSINALIGEIDACHTGNLSSAIRVHVLADMKARSDGD
jgi:predicted DNA-binding ribbon-helix-helix protein